MYVDNTNDAAVGACRGGIIVSWQGNVHIKELNSRLSCERLRLARWALGVQQYCWRHRCCAWRTRNCTCSLAPGWWNQCQLRFRLLLYMH